MPKGNPFGNTELLDCSKEGCGKPFFRTANSKRDVCGVCRAEARVQKARDELLIGNLQLEEATIAQAQLLDFLALAAPKYAAKQQELTSFDAEALIAAEGEGLANGAEAH